jgi:hypothetical protein
MAAFEPFRAVHLCAYAIVLPGKATGYDWYLQD